MKKRLILAALLASAVPAGAAAPSASGDSPPPVGAGAAPLQAPVPAAALKDWLAQGADTPAQLRIVESGTVNFALTVSPEGKVLWCAAEGQSGAPALDAKVCVMLLQRGQFHAALDSTGKPTLGVYRGIATWAAPVGNPPVVPLVEMAVGLQKMPQGLSDPAYIDLAVSVDAAGNVDGCTTGEGLDLSGLPIAARVDAGKVLGPTACAEAVKAMKLDPVKDAAGQTVRSIQTARILFTADAPTLASRGTDAAILVQGRKINGGTEVKIVPTKGVIRIVDYQAAGNELVLVQTSGGEWYRMELEPSCIGNSRLTKISRPNIAVAGQPSDQGTEVMVEHDMIDRLPRDLRTGLLNQIADNAIGPNGGIFLPPGMVVEEGLGFTVRSDGSVSRGDEVVATTIDGQDIVHIDSCRISSLVASDPPKGIKKAAPKKK